MAGAGAEGRAPGAAQGVACDRMSAMVTPTPVEQPTRVLVTGAGGYIGGHVVRALVAAGAQVVAVDRPGSKRAAEPGPVEIVEADLFAQTDAVLAHEVDAVLHLAWEAGFVHDAPAHMERLSDHVRFLDRVVEAGVQQVAVLGSMHEVGRHTGVIDEDTPTNPRSQYGIAKDALRRSLAVRLAGTGVTYQWLRCFYIYGDDARNSSVFTKIAQAAAEGRTTFPFTSGRNAYDFIEVGELGRQIAAAVMQREVDGVINCCSGHAVPLGEMAERFIRERGLDVRLLYGTFPDRDYDSPAVWGDDTKIRRILARR